jgi:hypothetical protein
VVSAGQQVYCNSLTLFGLRSIAGQSPSRSAYEVYNLSLLARITTTKEKEKT